MATLSYETWRWECVTARRRDQGRWCKAIAAPQLYAARNLPRPLRRWPWEGAESRVNRKPGNLSHSPLWGSFEGEGQQPSPVAPTALVGMCACAAPLTMTTAYFNRHWALPL